MNPDDPVPDTSPADYYWDFDNDTIPNPLDGDSDGDGLSDYREDTNGDGILEGTISGGSYPDYVTAYEPNPYDNDTDSDNLEDGMDIMFNGVLCHLGIFNASDSLRVASNNPDSDGDGINDDADPNPAVPTISGNSGSGTNPDNDGDGLNDTEEDTNRNGVYDEGTDYSDLNCADTDEDGLIDLFEAQNGTDPQDKDTDDDGLNDTEELTHGTYTLYPRMADSDGDGVPDGFKDTDDDQEYDSDIDGMGELGELSTGDGGLGSDPNDPDTDGDNLTDGNAFEVDWGDGFKITGSQDYDGDGVSCVLDWDSDNDNLSDGLETGTNGYYSVWEEDTDPADLDTDDDGLPDGWIDGWKKDPATGNWGYYGTTDGSKQMCEGEDLNLNGIPDYCDDIEKNETDPRLIDTNDDGINDGITISMGIKDISASTNNDWDGDGVPNGEDYEPRVNQLRLALKIYEVNLVHNRANAPDRTNFPDFLTKVYFDEYVNGEWRDIGEDSDKLGSNMANYQYNKQSISEVLTGNARWIKVKIELWDRDTSNPDDKIDITPKKGYTTLVLYYDMETSLWNGYGMFTNKNEYDNLKAHDIIEGRAAYKSTPLYEDFQVSEIMDRHDGIGYSTGRFDKENYEDAEIYFELYPSDSDGNYYDDDQDGLTHWSELYYWGTNVSNSDSDNDTMLDGWEVVHSLNPLDNSDKFGDIDSDNLDNVEEFEMRECGANPRNKDIFVEVDWMDDTGLHVDIEFTPYTKQKLGAIFAQEHFHLHIDDGCMGGGGTIDDYQESIDSAKWADEVGRKYVHHYENNNRRYFYYVLVCDKIDGDPRGNSIGHYKALSWHYSNPDLVAHGFTHELGHSIIDDSASHIKSEAWFNSNWQRFLNDKAAFLLYAGSEVNGRHCTNHDCTLNPFGMTKGDPIDYCDDCWDNVILT